MKLKLNTFSKLSTFLLLISRVIPFNNIRCFFYKLAGIEIGKGTFVARDAIIKKGVKLGKNVEIRSKCYLQYVRIGDNTVIDMGTLLIGVKNKNFCIGRECYVGINNILDGSGELEIGDYVHIASPGVGIWTHSSIYQVLLCSRIGNNDHRKEGKVKIGNNIWIGGNVTVYPNIEISDFCIILPNSVVNKNIPPKFMVGGTPIKKLKKIEIDNNEIRFIDL
ncbi:MAG: hypothetical protein L6282_06285 [Candidatus Methanoperedenaceae archaeon]|nr:hypothetical protein [Candidatus Methanoperedenaceae archaeon]